MTEETTTLVADEPAEPEFQAGDAVIVNHALVAEVEAYVPEADILVYRVGNNSTTTHISKVHLERVTPEPLPLVLELQLDNAPDGEQPVKRGPGRPRKDQRTDAEREADEQAAATALVAQGE